MNSIRLVNKPITVYLTSFDDFAECHLIKFNNWVGGFNSNEIAQKCLYDKF